MNNITRTPLLGKIMSAMIRGGQYQYDEFTTLNEKFDVLPKRYPPAGKYPILRAVGLGWGAMDMYIADDGEATPRIRQHMATDFALFSHLPIVLRRQNEDLTPAQRERYYLRTAAQYHGEDYWAYWLKRADFSAEETSMYIKRKLADGTIKIDPFTPSSANLNPTPVDLSEEGVNLLKGQSIISSTIISLPFDDFDINEIRNAAKIIKKATGRAIVSEICMVAGDVEGINIPIAGGGTVRYDEIIGAQITTFLAANYAFDFINQSLTDQLELGIAEPLFNIEGVN